MPPQSDNSVLESYGPGTRCVVHGSQWTIDGSPVRFGGGGGCYQVFIPHVVISYRSYLLSVTLSTSVLQMKSPLL